MPFDGLMLTAVVAELKSRLIGGRVTKVYQPNAAEIVLYLYAGGRDHRLLISAHPQHARIHLTRLAGENPPSPPPFCMLLRKYLEGTKVLELEQPAWERICRIRFSGVDDLGLPAERVLVAETMGKFSNVILTDSSGRILDALRRATSETNRYREVLPGRGYEPPPAQDKLDPRDEEAVARALFAEATGSTVAPEAPGPAQPQKVWQVLQRLVAGFSPLAAREAALRAGLDPEGDPGQTATGRVDAADSGIAGLTARIASETAGLARAATSGTEAPTAVLQPDGRVAAFAPYPLLQYPGLQRLTFATAGELLDQVMGKAAEEERLNQVRHSLNQVLDAELARNRRKLALQTEELRAAGNADQLRRYGELLTANLSQIPPRGDRVHLVDYYDPAGREVEITLDPSFSPSQNAQAYFRKYQKAKATLAATREHHDRTVDEIRYLEQVKASLESATSKGDLEEIRLELAAGGYLKHARSGARSLSRSGVHSTKGTRSGAGKTGAKAGRKPGVGTGRNAPTRVLPSAPLRFLSGDGLEILVGKNNRQNDQLTMKQAGPEDLWFHTKDIPGSHVILRLPPGIAEPPLTSLEQAALLAAYYSKARGSAKVPVDFTRRRYVRKPPGAKPGMVIYDHHRTIYITPTQGAVDELRRSDAHEAP
ncbi:MAG: NFACT family protein [Firmicutes bacterium]|nr:NFACT family protein [Bacillota bacterium]